MIGTSILTVYQGHISTASLKSGADEGWIRRPDSYQRFFSEGWTDFSFLSRTKTKLATLVKILIMF